MNDENGPSPIVLPSKLAVERMHAIQDWFANLPSATVPAWLGLFLSAVLAAVKAWELVRDRARVQVDAVFSSSVSVGNEIRIRNVSPKSQMLVHWELFYRSSNPLRRREAPIAIATSIAGATIAPASEHALTFSDQEYFSTNVSALNGRGVYMRLWFAGRRPICRKIYPFQRG